MRQGNLTYFLPFCLTCVGLLLEWSLPLLRLEGYHGIIVGRIGELLLLNVLTREFANR